LPYQIHFLVTPKRWKRDSSWYMFVGFYVFIFVWLKKSELFQSIYMIATKGEHVAIPQNHVRRIPRKNLSRGHLCFRILLSGCGGS
jgi:hypothetical protein